MTMRNPMVLAGVAAAIAWVLAVSSVRAQVAPQGPSVAAAPGAHGQGFRAKFAAANTSHDGHLTRAQAEAGNMPMVARNFDAIDTDHKGYVTMKDLRAFMQARRAARAGAPPQS
jgi:hypothetical protein